MRHILLFFLAIIPFGLSAQTDDEPRFNTMVITLTDGTVEKVPLLTEPRITYQDSLFVITTALNTKTLPRNKVKFYRFTNEDANGVEIVPKTPLQVKWEVVDRQLRLSRVPSGGTTRLYTINGQQIMSTHRSGHFIINLTGLASGVYMLDVNGLFHKIVLL